MLRPPLAELTIVVGLILGTILLGEVLYRATMSVGDETSTYRSYSDEELLRRFDQPSD